MQSTSRMARDRHVDMRGLLGSPTSEHLLLLLRLVLHRQHSRTLLGHTLGAALAQRLVAQTAGLHLVGKVLRARLLRLGLVDMLHKHTLVLEHVTLRLEVELVVPGAGQYLYSPSRMAHVQMLVNLARLAVLPQQTAEHTLAAHPLHLGRETSLGGTLALTGTGVTTETLGSVGPADALLRGRIGRLADNLTVLDQLPHIGTGVGVADVALLGGVLSLIHI